MDLARYAELFRTEAREQLRAIDVALAGLEGPEARPHVDALFRGVHTIKGMAGAMGYAPVEQVAHAIESALGQLRAEWPDDGRVGHALVHAVADGVDALARCVDDAVEGRSAVHAPAAVLTQLAERSRPVHARDGQALGGESRDRTSHDPGALAREPRRREAARDRASGAARERVRHARVDVRHLDALLNLVGELVITRDRLLRAADESGDRAVRAAALDASRLVAALQDEVMAARMVPVGEVFDRFPRVVREVARTLGKRVTLEVEGRDLTADRSMLDAIGEPLVHLLRNAVDHGLEPEAEREAAGKPPVGRVWLRAERERDTLVLAVRDDGRGIDHAVLRARAIGEGRLPADAPALDDAGLLRLLAQPGFSTAATVTSVSGRGVGIDVVASSVRALGGQLSLQTQQGQGTTFTLRLPLTLAIVRALLVQVGAHTYAVPSAQIIEAVDAEHTPATVHEGREMVTVRADTLPLVRLRVRFGGSDTRTIVTDGVTDGPTVLVLEAAGRRVACEVDGLLGQQDIVVKSFAPLRNASPWFSGATILGDGSPALIVDVGNLA